MTTTMTTETVPGSDDPDLCASDADRPPEPERSASRPARIDSTQSSAGPGGSSPAAASVVIRLAADDDSRPEPAGDGGSDADASWIHDHLERALALLESPVARINVAIVDDARMTDLHRRHLGIDAPTDVLTFPISAPGEPIEADVAVNRDEAGRQARRRGHAPRQEMLLYALHGVLHCAGFDDHDDAAGRAMHAEEDRILRTIGVGETFARSADRAPARRISP